MAAVGVLNPRPTSLYHLLPFLPGRADLTLVLLLRKTAIATTVSNSSYIPLFLLVVRSSGERIISLGDVLCGCFWKARSLWTVSSVAILSLGVYTGKTSGLSVGVVVMVEVQNQGYLNFEVLEWEFSTVVWSGGRSHTSWEKAVPSHTNPHLQFRVGGV